jgi:hypothetical protein
MSSRRNSVTSSRSSSSVLREKAEAKLYHLRNQHSPTEFEDEVDKQIELFIKNAEMDRKKFNFKKFLKTFWCF